MFDSIKNFLLEHWELVLSSLLFLVSFVLGLVRKKPVWNKLDQIKSLILEKLPIFIDLVEKSGHGHEKKQAVLALVSTYCQDIGFYNYEDIMPFVSEAIEMILMTPQKKKEE